MNEGTSGIYTATLVDETGTPVQLANISAMTLTLYDKDTGSIINSRDDQNVLNNNGVTIHATSGLLTWAITEDDSPIINDRKWTEWHKALFEFSYGSNPVKYGKHEVDIRVVNLSKVS